MTPEDARNLVAQVGTPVLMARLAVILSYERRTSKIWTGGLPTLGLLAFVARVAIAGGLDLSLTLDWVSVVFWVILIAPQAIAVAYGWFPERLFRRIWGKGAAS